MNSFDIGLVKIAAMIFAVALLLIVLLPELQKGW
jgi:hypothetical protein